MPNILDRYPGKWDVSFRDLFNGIEFHDDLVKENIEVPDSFFQKLLDYFMERSYLNEASNRSFDSLLQSGGSRMINWIRITHLPINPSNDESYDLLSRWQGVLSTMHAWNYRLVFLLLRYNGETKLYLGTSSSEQSVSSTAAVDQLREAVSGNMPGIGLELVAQGSEAYTEIGLPLTGMSASGAVTGIPSLRAIDGAVKLQTLDPLAFGIRDRNGLDRNYALMITADPLNDGEISELISRLRELGSQIHTNVSTSLNESRSSSESKEVGLSGYGAATVGRSVGSIAGSLLNLIPYAGPILAGIATTVAEPIAVGAAAKNHKNISLSNSSAVTKTYLDKYAEYAEQLTEKHIERLKEGRNLGFWNTGVYVLGETASDIRTVTGMLRSIYSGKESYVEPIRTHLFRPGSHAENFIHGCELIPLYCGDVPADADKEWHILGKPYQYLSTPINTAELSIASSLPRRDVPGLRFVKTAIRFASNPALSGKDYIELGKVVDMGVEQKTPYRIDPNILVRHAFVCGVTGCGKTTTCKNLIKEVMSRGIPALIIEPAKDDYVRWAIDMNKKLPKDKQIKIYMPGGTKQYEGAQELKLNLFQPAAIKGANIDLLQHSENLSMLINACLPSEEVIPILIDETIARVIDHIAGADEDLSDTAQRRAYPSVDGLIDSAYEIMDAKGYDPKVKENFKEILLTRFSYLKRGIRGKVFNTLVSTDYNDLFSHPTVINISRLAGSKEKSLIMSMLLLALYEYRMSAYQYDKSYRSKAQENRLMHLTLIEEAHNVLSNPPQSSSGDPRQAAADLFSNILSEIRGYGEGIVVVDQTPVKMIPDVIKNTNLKICHRLVSRDDCDVIASGLALREDQKTMIPSLEIGNAIVCGDMDDAAAWIKMPRS